MDGDINVPNGFAQIIFPDTEPIIFMGGILRLNIWDNFPNLELSPELVEPFRIFLRKGMFELSPHLQNKGEVIYNLGLYPKATHPYLLVTACRMLDPHQVWSAKIFSGRQYISLQGENFSLVIPTDFSDGRFKYIIWKQEQTRDVSLVLEGLLHDEERFSICWRFKSSFSGIELCVKTIFSPTEADPEKQRVFCSIQGNLPSDMWTHEIAFFIKEVLGCNHNEFPLGEGRDYCFQLNYLCLKSCLLRWAIFFHRIRNFILKWGQLTDVVLSTLFNDFLTLGSITATIVHKTR